VSDGDPHVHVDVKLGGEALTRNLLASTFGLMSDVPATVTTGCGVAAPRAMTSASAAAVTCLACREFAHREHLRLADQLDRLGTLPGSPLDAGQSAAAAAHHRTLARQFAD
jgi:hypothetical protein